MHIGTLTPFPFTKRLVNTSHLPLAKTPKQRHQPVANFAVANMGIAPFATSTVAMVTSSTPQMRRKTI